MSNTCINTSTRQYKTNQGTQKLTTLTHRGSLGSSTKKVQLSPVVIKTTESYKAESSKGSSGPLQQSLNEVGSDHDAFGIRFMSSSMISNIPTGCRRAHGTFTLQTNQAIPKTVSLKNQIVIVRNLGSLTLSRPITSPTQQKTSPPRITRIRPMGEGSQQPTRDSSSAAPTEVKPFNYKILSTKFKRVRYSRFASVKSVNYLSVKSVNEIYNE